MKYPGTPQLKLKYNLTQITRLESKAAIELLSSRLKSKEYEILKETDKSLIFFNNPWKLRWNFQPYIALDGGNVEIKTYNDIKSISFGYYLDCFPFLLMSSLLIFSTAIDRQFDATFFFACFYFIASIISIIRAKLAAKQILREILNEDDVS